jgi:hypothetical protein
MGEAKRRKQLDSNYGKKINKNLQRIRKKYGKEIIPCLPKIYYPELDEVITRQACLEYWEIHDFSWHHHIYAKLNFTPTVAKDYLLRDFPGDIASALSTKVFEDWYKSTLLVINDDREIERMIRRFCLVVCGLGKAMQIISAETYLPISAEDLFNSALLLTECQKD